MPRFLHLALAVTLTASALAAPPIGVESPESAGMSTARLNRIDTAMQGYVDRNEVAGAVEYMVAESQ